MKLSIEVMELIANSCYIIDDHFHDYQENMISLIKSMKQQYTRPFDPNSDVKKEVKENRKIKFNVEPHQLFLKQLEFNRV